MMTGIRAVAGEFPQPTEDEYKVGEATDRKAAIEGEVWAALESGIEGGWVTNDEAEERLAEWRDKYDAS